MPTILVSREAATAHLELLSPLRGYVSIWDIGLRAHARSYVLPPLRGYSKCRLRAYEPRGGDTHVHLAAARLAAKRRQHIAHGVSRGLLDIYVN